KAVCGPRLLDLLDRLLAEVRDRRQLGLGLHHQVAYGLDPDPLQAVVRPYAELELLDREVLRPVRERGLRRSAIRRGGGLAEAFHLLDVGEDRQLADEDLGRLADRLARVERTVGRDVEPELVVIRPLADTGGLDLV